MSNEIKSITGVLATSNPQAAAAGAEIMREGGNAIDAAVGAILTLCVCSPASVGLCGYGGTMIAWLAKEKRVVAIDFDSRCPLKWTPESYGNPEESNFSWKAVSVPGVPAGLDLALRTCGTRGWKDVAKRALQLAEEGFEVDNKTLRQLEEWRGQTDQTSLRALFGSGSLPQPQSLWVQKDHAAVLRKIIEQGVGVMYHGEIPREISRQVQANGGTLSEEDFEKYEASIVDPLHISYRGHDIYSPPPPAGAITSMEILKIIEQFDLKPMTRTGVEYLHTLAEAIKWAWGDRNQSIGDPKFVNVPIDMILSDAHAKKLADEIRKGGVANVTGKADSGKHTVNVCAGDSQGNMVSLTATQGYLFGSRRIAQGLGLVLNHGLSRFDYSPGHPNGPQPGKRMHHNMSPMLVVKDGTPRWVFGLPGGTKIVNVTAQLAMNLIDWHLSPGECIFAPRVHSEGADPIMISTSIDKPVIEELKKMGHDVRREQTIGGPANVIQLDGKQITAASGNGAESVGIA